MAAILVAAFFQPTAPRLVAALVFALAVIIHDRSMGDFDGLAYYSSDALFNLAVIILLSGISPTPTMVLRVQLICFVSILLDFMGWAAWYAYLPPLLYNVAFMALYAWTLITFIRRDDSDVGGFGISAWRSCFRFNAHPWIVNYCKHGKTP